MAAFPGIRSPAVARAIPRGPRLRILDSYVLREMAGPFAFALANALLLGTLALYAAYMRLIEGRLPRTGLP